MPPATAQTDALAQARRLLSTDPAAAARLARTAGRSDAALLTLAAALRRSGDAAAARAVAAELVARQPQAWGVRYELGMAAAALGDPAAAADLAQAARRNPAATLPVHACWDLLILAQANPPPRPPLRALTDAAIDRATAAWLAGDPQARRILAHDHGLDPNDVAAACLLAEVGLRQGAAVAVAAMLRTALAIAPGYAPARFRLAEALHRASMDEEAIAVLATLAHGDAATTVFALTGAVLLRLGRVDGAGEAILRARTLSPDRPDLHIAEARVHRAAGRREEAIACCRQALRHAPAPAEAYASLADLKTGALTAADAAAIDRLLDDQTLPAGERGSLLFARARRHEEQDQPEAAFRRYAEANRLRRAAAPWDADAHDRRVADTIRAFTPAVARSHPGGHDTLAPIFVVGMPRSGSTLVEQILASHGAIEGASELPVMTNIARRLHADPRCAAGVPRLPPAELRAIGADYLARAAAYRQSDAPRFVDKFPGNALLIPLIALALPDAVVIDVRREARDCCVSLYTQDFAQGQAYSYDLADLGRYYRAYAAAMDHFERVLPGRILRVGYEALVGDLAGETRRMLDHCGLAMEPACLRFFDNPRAVRTASSEQVREPIHRRAIGRAERFATWLGPLDAALRMPFREHRNIG